MKHATVKIGEYTVPLLGIPKEAVEETCIRCKRKTHLSEIGLDGICHDCVEGRTAAAKLKDGVSGE